MYTPSYFKLQPQSDTPYASIHTPISLNKCNTINCYKLGLAYCLGLPTACLLPAHTHLENLIDTLADGLTSTLRHHSHHEACGCLLVGAVGVRRRLGEGQYLGEHVLGWQVDSQRVQSLWENSVSSRIQLWTWAVAQVSCNVYCKL